MSALQKFFFLTQITAFTILDMFSPFYRLTLPYAMQPTPLAIVETVVFAVYIFITYLWLQRSKPLPRTNEASLVAASKNAVLPTFAASLLPLTFFLPVTTNLAEFSIAQLFISSTISFLINIWLELRVIQQTHMHKTLNNIVHTTGQIIKNLAEQSLSHMRVISIEIVNLILHSPGALQELLAPIYNYILNLGQHYIGQFKENRVYFLKQQLLKLSIVECVGKHWNFIFDNIVESLKECEELYFAEQLKLISLLKFSDPLYLNYKKMFLYVLQNKNIFLRGWYYIWLIETHYIVNIYVASYTSYFYSFFTSSQKSNTHYNYDAYRQWAMDLVVEKPKIETHRGKFYSLKGYDFLKKFLFPSIVSGLLALLLIDYFDLIFVRQLAIWAVIGFLTFWLFSGFNFFLKRYQHGKFTSGVQRFWKRSNAYFWLIEGFLFLIFFYYYLNSSQEPLYMFDESNLQQTQCLQLLTAYESYVLLVYLIGHLLYCQLRLSTSQPRAIFAHLLVLTTGFFFIMLNESYQFYYCVTKFNELTWSYNEAENLWTQETENNRIRVKYQYLMIALLVKYWHFIFIFINWVFVLIKTWELKKLSFTMLGLLSQNLLILFSLNLFFYLNWGKWVSRRFYDSAYYWFFTAPNDIFVETLIQEIILLIYRCALQL